MGAVLAALLAGCGSKESNSGSGAAKPELVDARQFLPNAPEGTMIHLPLTSAVAQHFESKGRLPASFDELVSAGFIKAVPPPPEGKRFQFDRASMQVLVLPQ
jgi:hypothetical protein